MQVDELQRITVEVPLTPEQFSGRLRAFQCIFTWSAASLSEPLGVNSTDCRGRLFVKTGTERSATPLTSGLFSYQHEFEICGFSSSGQNLSLVCCSFDCCVFAALQVGVLIANRLAVSASRAQSSPMHDEGGSPVLHVTIIRQHCHVLSPSINLCV